MSDNEIAKPYEDLSSHASDNEYLYYIHFRLGHANSVLVQIRTLLGIIAVILSGLFGSLWHAGVIG
jgi:hypothetical protein